MWRERRGTPDTLPETLDRVMARGDGEVQMIVAPLEDVWRCSGTRLLAYRDGTARHHPITAHGGRCGAVLNDGDVWETRIDLPDNPEVRSPEAFRFDEEIDLLDYAWTTTCEVVRCVERVLPQVYALAVPGREPSRWFWLNE